MRLHTTTSTTLLEGLKDAGNQTLWAQYVDRYRPLIVGYCRKIGLEMSDAEDLAQESLLAFAKGYRAGDYDPRRGRLRSWLFGIVRNTLRDWRSARGRSPEIQPAETEGRTGLLGRVPGEDRLAALWEKEWRKAVIRQCMEEVRRQVEARTFLAFDLFACRDWPAEQVASHLDMSPNAVYAAKCRVLRRMRELRPRVEEIW